MRGWVKLWSFTEPADNLLDYRDTGDLPPGGRWQPIRLAEAGGRARRWWARFEGCADRDAGRSRSSAPRWRCRASVAGAGGGRILLGRPARPGSGHDGRRAARPGGAHDGDRRERRHGGRRRAGATGAVPARAVRGTRWTWPAAAWSSTGTRISEGARRALRGRDAVSRRSSACVGRFGVVGRALERGLLRLGTTTRGSSRRTRTARWTIGRTAADLAW
jgi:hypothetical protein